MKNQLFYKFQNGNKIYYELKENNQVDMFGIIQNLIELTEKLYDETIDSVDASYKLNEVITDLIEIKD